MPKYYLILCFCIALARSYGQAIPDVLKFNATQSTMTIGNQTENRDPELKCYIVAKSLNRITFQKCNEATAERVFQIKGIEKEKRGENYYSIQYYGYETIFDDQVYSFITFGYSNDTRKWTVMFEIVLDPNGLILRNLTKYFNIN